MLHIQKTLFVGGSLLLGAVPSLAAQRIAVDSQTVTARFALMSPTPEAGLVHTLRMPADSAGRHHMSQGAATGLGFLAGAAAGLVIAHFVNQNVSEGKLENYFGIPLALGVFTAATVFVATDD